jgi:hypothetical protein
MFSIFHWNLLRSPKFDIDNNTIWDNRVIRNVTVALTPDFVMGRFDAGLPFARIVGDSVV